MLAAVAELRSFGNIAGSFWCFVGWMRRSILFQAIPYYVVHGGYTEMVQFLVLTLPFSVMHLSNVVVSIANITI
jgi:hypothetical protein